MRREKRLIDADVLLDDLASLYEAAGWAEHEVHFSLLDIEENIREQEEIEITEVVKDTVKEMRQNGLLKRSDDAAYSEVSNRLYEYYRNPDRDPEVGAALEKIRDAQPYVVRINDADLVSNQEQKADLPEGFFSCCSEGSAGMSDLISRQEAIDTIEREQSLVERPITETRWFDLGLRKAQEVLSDLPSAQPEPQWIPCSERLPEEDERVLCTHTGGLNPNRQVIEHIYQNGKFTLGWDMDMNPSSPTFGQRYMGDVIAWMPLPEPYYAERRTDE